jgi:phosphatidylserine decarboxylase
MRVLPLRAYTRAMRALGGVPLPEPLREPVFGRVAAAMGMDLSEAELPVSAYRTFSDLFVRRLQPGARPIDVAPDALVSPVDAELTTRGEVQRGCVVQAKGIDYSLPQLLDDAALADSLEGGQFFTLYLRPKDYHRIHAPVSGRLLGQRTVGGRLLPVKPYMVRNVGDLLARNERLWFQLEGELGRVVVVCVAAAGVGTITVAEGLRESGVGRSGAPKGAQVQKGQEIAAFNIGSTVIVFAEAGCHLQPAQIMLGEGVRVGQPLARRQRQSVVS